MSPTIQSVRVATGTQRLGHVVVVVADATGARVTQVTVVGCLLTVRALVRLLAGTSVVIDAISALTSVQTAMRVQCTLI